MASSPIASSSSRMSTGSLKRSSSKPLIADVFKPRLPRDPFVDTHEPWALKVDDVISATNAHSRRDVLLILGAPSLMDLEPLLQSPQLESSLLVLATHQPPDISATYPAIHILRLSDPLAIEDAGAVRFVNILECAERIARVWRKAGGHGIHESLEADMETTSGAASLPPPNVFRFGSESAPNSPQLSNERLAASEKPPTAIKKRRHRTMSSINLKSFGVPLPPADIFQRPFDCILNFLPAGVSDKALLKQSILVTTISRPFLTALSNPALSNTLASPVSAADSVGRRWRKGLSLSSMHSAPVTPSSRSRASLFSGLQSPSNSSHNMHTVVAPPRRAHLIHLIPPTRQPTVSRAKLMQSMESFLCSFAYPSPLEIGKADFAGVERAAPFLMHPYVLRTVVQHVPATTTDVKLEWTIAELLLSGALDYSLNKGEMGKSMPRAWISSVNDVTFVSSSSHDSMASPALPQPPPSPTIRERQREGAPTRSADLICRTELGMLTPEASSLSTPNTTLNSIKPPSSMERAFRLPFRVSEEKNLHTPAGSVESDGSGSTRVDHSGLMVRRFTIVGGSKAKLKQFVKQGKENSKWKFWKVPFATAASA